MPPIRSLGTRNSAARKPLHSSVQRSRALARSVASNCTEIIDLTTPEPSPPPEDTSSSPSSSSKDESTSMGLRLAPCASRSQSPETEPAYVVWRRRVSACGLILAEKKIGVFRNMEDTLIAVDLAYDSIFEFMYSSGSTMPVGYCIKFDDENLGYVFADVQGATGAGPEKLGLWVEMQEGIQQPWLLQPVLPLGCSCPPSCGSTTKATASVPTAAPSYIFQVRYERRYKTWGGNPVLDEVELVGSYATAQAANRGARRRLHEIGADGDVTERVDAHGLLNLLIEFGEPGDEATVVVEREMLKE